MVNYYLHLGGNNCYLSGGPLTLMNQYFDKGRLELCVSMFLLASQGQESGFLWPLQLKYFLFAAHHFILYNFGN